MVPIPTHPPGTSGLHLVHIDGVISPAAKRVKLDVSRHTLDLDLRDTGGNAFRTFSDQQSRKRDIPTIFKARSMSMPWLQGTAGLARQSPALPLRDTSTRWRRR